MSCGDFRSHGSPVTSHYSQRDLPETGHGDPALQLQDRVVQTECYSVLSTKGFNCKEMSLESYHSMVTEIRVVTIFNACVICNI